MYPINHKKRERSDQSRNGGETILLSADCYCDFIYNTLLDINNLRQYIKTEERCNARVM